MSNPKPIQEILPKALAATLAPPTQPSRSNTPGLDEFFEFDTLGDPALEEMLGNAQDFVSLIHAKAQPRWISLLGSCGAGKTMLGNLILGWVKKRYDGRIDKERTTTQHIYRYNMGMLKWVDCMNWMLNRDYGWVEQAKTDWLVFIDDIGVKTAGSDKVQAMAAGKLFEILEARREKWTILTSNLMLVDISKNIDARVASRMLRNESLVTEVEVMDYNLRKRLAKKKKGAK